jgi:hypothetical protein
MSTSRKKLADHFLCPPEPRSTHHHVVDKELEEAKDDDHGYHH